MTTDATPAVHYRDALNQLNLPHDIKRGYKNVLPRLRDLGLEVQDIEPYGRGFRYYVSAESLERVKARRQAAALIKDISAMKDPRDKVTAELPLAAPPTDAQVLDRLLEVVTTQNQMLSALSATVVKLEAKVDHLLKLWDAEVSDGK